MTNHKLDNALARMREMRTGEASDLARTMEQVKATIDSTFEPWFALAAVIGLLPDCEHPTSRGVCPHCIAEAVIAAGWLPPTAPAPDQPATGHTREGETA